MPRGVYDRTKKKGTTTAPVVAKTEVVRNQKKAPVATKGSKNQEQDGALGGHAVMAVFEPNKIAEAHFGFQILAANLTTLSESYGHLENTNMLVLGPMGTEILATLNQMAKLRKEVFGDDTSPVPAKSPAVEKAAEKKHEVLATPPAPVAPTASLPQPSAVTGPVLPQGNATAYQPPAPPALTLPTT